MFREVTRGRLKQLETSGGQPVEAKLFGCAVVRPPYERGGKTYMELDLSRAVGDVDVVRKIDEHVRRSANPSFSPLRDPRLIVKVPRGAKYETVRGEPGYAFAIAESDLIDVVASPGAFGPFGYCMLARRLKPHATRQEEVFST